MRNLAHEDSCLLRTPPPTQSSQGAQEVSTSGNQGSHFSRMFGKMPSGLAYPMPGSLPWKRSCCLLQCFLWHFGFLFVWPAFAKGRRQPSEWEHENITGKLTLEIPKATKERVNALRRGWPPLAAPRWGEWWTETELSNMQVHREEAIPPSAPPILLTASGSASSLEPVFTTL